MQIHVTLLFFAVILVASIESKPTWSSFHLSTYDYPSETFAVQPLLRYHSPQYIYKTRTDFTVPTTVITEEKTFHHLPTYSFYYGTPIYKVYPILKVNGNNGTPTSTTTSKPIEENDENVETLDSKAELQQNKKKPDKTMGNNGNNAVVVESI